MMSEHSPEDQRHRILEAMRRTGLDIHVVWLHYFSIGGDLDEFDLDAYLHGMLSLTSLDRNTIAHAVKELTREIHRQVPPHDGTCGDA